VLAAAVILAGVTACDVGSASAPAGGTGGSGSVSADRTAGGGPAGGPSPSTADRPASLPVDPTVPTGSGSPGVAGSGATSGSVPSAVGPVGSAGRAADPGAGDPGAGDSGQAATTDGAKAARPAVGPVVGPDPVASSPLDSVYVGPNGIPGVDPGCVCSNGSDPETGSHPAANGEKTDASTSERSSAAVSRSAAGGERTGGAEHEPLSAAETADPVGGAGADQVGG
jgi:hypothetical protein